MEKPKIENYKLGKGFHTHDYVSDLTLYTDQIETQLKEVSKLNDSFPNGLGDYEWKIIENFNSKNFRIAELEAENKELIESIEALLILIDPRLQLIDGEIIGKDRGKSIVWKKVVKTAQDLIKQK